MPFALGNILAVVTSYREKLEDTMPPTDDWLLPFPVFVALGFGAAVYRSVFAMGDYAGSGLPLAAEPQGKKSFTLRTRLRYYSDCAALYTEAYRQVSPGTSPCTTTSGTLC